MRRTHKLYPVVQAISSLKLTVVCLGLLMVLVAACTLAEVQLGTFGAVKLFFRSFLLYWRIPYVQWRIPVFPAGGAVGAVLLVNLIAGHLTRLEPSWRKIGLWLAHLGLIALFAGEFITGMAAVESQMAIPEGSTLNFSENPEEAEIAIVDASEPKYDQVYSIPECVFGKKMKIEDARLPFTVLVKRYYPNAALQRRTAVDKSVRSLADAGFGPQVLAFELPTVTEDDQVNQPAAYVELINGDSSLGTFLLSTAMPRPQEFKYDGRNWRISMRPTRYYLPFSITLKKFSHDVYAGTDIPKNFSSVIRLQDPTHGEDREVRIYMNHPLRYGGKTFFQASYAKNDTLSIFQVTRNPGWLLPYFSCAMVFAGLLIHFLMKFRLDEAAA